MGMLSLMAGDREARAGEGKGGATVAAPEEPVVLTLEEAIDLALVRNPQVLKAQEEIRKTKGMVIEVTSRRYPRATLTGNTQAQERSRFETFGNFGDTPLLEQFEESTDAFMQTQQGTWDLGLEVRQVLYAGGRISGNIRIARLQQEEAIYAFDVVVQDTVAAVRKAFYEALRQRSLITVNEQQVGLLGEELEDQRQRFEAGAVPEFNTLRAEVELGNARPPLIRARNAYRVALAELGKLINHKSGPDGEVGFTVSGDLRDQAPHEYSLQEGLVVARVNRGEIAAMKTRVRAAEEQLGVDAALLKPEVTAFGGYDFLGSRFRGYDEYNEGGIVGIQFEWTLWDSGEKKGRQEQTRAKMRQAELDVEEEELQIELEVRRAWSSYVEAKELIESQRKNVSVAEESLRLARARFDAGTATQLEVLDSQTALTQARTNALEARADFEKAVADLERAMGVIARGRVVRAPAGEGEEKASEDGE